MIIQTSYGQWASPRAFERASLCKYLYCLDRWVKDHIDKQRVSKLVIQSGPHCSSSSLVALGHLSILSFYSLCPDKLPRPRCSCLGAERPCQKQRQRHRQRQRQWQMLLSWCRETVSQFSSTALTLTPAFVTCQGSITRSVRLSLHMRPTVLAKIWREVGCSKLLFW